MKLTVWSEERKRFFVSGFKFLATCDKLYINDKAVELDADTKLIIDAWEIRLGKIRSEKNNAGSKIYVAEEIDIYTFPYLIVQNLAEEFGDNNTLLIKVAKE
jgi:hypothetical protein